MNTQPDDGGPAFPGNQGVDGYGNAVPIAMPDGSVAYVIQNQGMSLRDYLATHAPASDIESCMPDTVGELAEWLGLESYRWKDHFPMAVSKARYIWADAMLAARKRKEEP